MGILLDIVPNHMGVAANDNAWWNDVLAHGPHSRHAGHFDIDWDSADADLRGKVLLPFLDGSLDAVLAAGQLGVVRAESGEALLLAWHDWRWPLTGVDDAAAALALDARSAHGREGLRALLQHQHYRLADWRCAGDRINWRRFFDISELAALRVEDAQVFADVHRELFALFEAGIVDGVRVDHVDGLADPLAYCHRLRDELAARGDGVYIVVEKVFAAHEPQRDWGVAGTTGYDFMDQVGAVLHNPAGQAALDVLWRDLSGAPWDPRTRSAEARREILEASFGADRARVARSFCALAAWLPDGTALAPASILRALSEIIVAFPVYRYYGLPGDLPPEDAAILAAAIERANRHLDTADYPALDFIARCLREVQEGVAALQRAAAVRFQQVTAGVAARAIEDTLFYREARLLSRNEVGSDPNVFSLTADEFHAGCVARAQRFPHGLLATATHDHKRGEDARARLAVLSEHADAWVQAVARWREMNAACVAQAGNAPAPDAIDELILYQTLVGHWPLAAAQADEFHARIAQWYRKALREAKRHTRWTAPDAAYEDACLRFLATILEPRSDNLFPGDLACFVDAIAAAGALNSLTQTFLRLTTPGVPDLYQGCEFWDFSLVDPDNRRAVDYASRRAALAAAPILTASLGHWRDAAVKQQLIARVLRHRADTHPFYAEAGYEPLLVGGARAAHALAFERRAAHGRLLCVATRWALSLADGVLAQPHVAAAQWQDTHLQLGEGARYTDVLHGGGPFALQGEVPVATLLGEFPVAMLFAPA
jgi:(1->4)-alpha-D-glucan 1-alpha-D-glucosylmutase